MGSVLKKGQARKSLWIETIGLQLVSSAPGQARKSLWIETPPFEGGLGGGTGQARKSLWIET